MYTVHVKRITATDARKNWFRILDEVAAGEEVVVERAGRRIVIRREEEATGSPSVPDYSEIIRVPEADRADEWGWEWGGPEGDLTPVDRSE